MLAALLSIVLIAPGAAAQDGGTRSVLSAGAGNRALAMGGAYTAIADDASAPLWNPGGLGFVQRPQFQGSRTGYFGLDMSEEFLGLVVPRWRLGTLAATFRHFGSEGLDGRDAGNFATGEFSDSETQMTLSYGRRLGDAWGIGASFKLVNQSLAGRAASGFGMNAGILASPARWLPAPPEWMERVSLGLAVDNLVEPTLQLDRDSVTDPMATRVGFAYRHPLGGPDRVLTAAVDLETVRHHDPDLYAGLELRLLPFLALRTGLRQGVPTLGTRAEWRDFAFDYVFESTGLDPLHRFGVTVAFGRDVETSRAAALQREQEALDARLGQAFARRQSAQAEALIEQAEAAFAAGRHGETLEILAVASVIAPENPSVPALRVRSLLAQARDEEGRSAFAEAAVTYGEILSLEPSHPEATAGSERCRAESQRLDDRSARLQERFSLGLDAFTTGDLTGARDRFIGILVEHPGDEDAAKMLARTETAIDRRADELEEQARGFIRARRFGDAEAALAEAGRLLPDAHRLGDTRAMLADARRAERAGARNQAPRDPGPSPAPAPPRLSDAQKAELRKFYENGVSALKAGRAADAIRYWEWVYSLDPEYRGVREILKREHHLLGIQAFSEGRVSEAVGFWEAALRFDPDDAKTRAYLERARQQLERSRAVAGDKP
jgi:tetratricopeptide (TPR) repeat protein